MTSEMLTLKRLHEVLHYDQESGQFTWLIAPFRKPRMKGTIAGCNRGDGYIRIRIDGKRYAAHRLAMFYMTGEWPEIVDHKDLDHSNNRWSNLRATNHQGNSANRAIICTNTSGMKGVSFSKKTGKWTAGIVVRNKRKYLGQFSDKSLAAQAYADAAKHYFGDFARVI